MKLKLVELICALCCVLALANGEPSSLLKAVVLHRHGARTSAGIVHGQIEYNAPFGVLTPRGAEQCRAVGKFLRGRYGSNLAIPETYKASRLKTLTTAVKRVVASAEAFLEGLFESDTSMPTFAGTATYPTSDADNLLMSPWNAVPAFVLQDRYNTMLRRMTPMTYEVLSKEDIDHFLKVLDISPKYCEAKPYFCVELLQDVIFSNITLGNPIDPRCESLLPAIMGLEAVFVNEMLGYLPSGGAKKGIARLDDNGRDRYIEEVGSAGYPWVTEALEYLLNKQSGNESRLRHYAAHDYTLTSVFGALGTVMLDNYELEETVPRYAETILLELHQEGPAQRLKAFRGYPSQEPSGNISFSVQPMRIMCKAEDGTISNGADEGCLAQDLARFVHSTKGREGLCYHTSEMMRSNGRCDLPDSPTVLPNGSGYGCVFFRKRCPMVPCALSQGLVADPARGYACIPAAPLTTNQPPTAQTLWTSVACLVIATLAFLALRRHKGE